jgi:cyanophycinase
VKKNGALVIIGGAEDKEEEQLILKEFVRLAGGAKARIVVMTVATNLPQELGDEYERVFRKLGVDDVCFIDVSDRKDASAEERLKTIKQATGVYFTGGNQLHVTSLLGGSPMSEILRERHAKGLIVAGTSAGAAMMSNSMIISGEADSAPRFGEVGIGPGMDFVPYSMIDTHFSQRGRFGRLLTAVAHYPQNLGFGIDENTAMIVEDKEFQVIGENTVTVIDAGAITYTNLPDLEENQALTVHGVVVHVLADGHRFDLEQRAPIAKERTGERAHSKGRAKTAKSKK